MTVPLHAMCNLLPARQTSTRRKAYTRRADGRDAQTGGSFLGGRNAAAAGSARPHWLLLMLLVFIHKDLHQSPHTLPHDVAR